MSMTMLVLIARARQQPMKTLKKKMVLRNRGITITEVAGDVRISFGQAIFTAVHRSGDVGDV